MSLVKLLFGVFGHNNKLYGCHPVFTLLVMFGVGVSGFSGYYNNDGLSGRNKLLLILVDGCRWDYPDQEGLPGFRKLEDNGVRAPYVTPIFPSNSYPNWYTITTGIVEKFLNYFIYFLIFTVKPRSYVLHVIRERKRTKRKNVVSDII